MTVDYDPVNYWQKEGSTYLQRFVYTSEYLIQEQAIIEYLKTIEFKTVLELGCGFGRISDKILSNFRNKIDKYTVVDCSQAQLEHAQLYLMEYTNIEYKYQDIQQLDLKETYDLVISVEVLMHQLPDKIKSIIDKTIELSNRHVVNVDYFTTFDEPLESHNFLHNYLQLYPYRVTGTKISGVKQWIFHIQK